MKKLLLTTLLLLSLLPLWIVLPANAQDGGATSPYDPTTYRPLGRFSVDGHSLVISPDGYFIAGIRTIEEIIEAEDDAEATDTDDIESVDETENTVDSAEADQSEETSDSVDNEPSDEAEPEPTYIDMLTMWDIRGGQIIWSVPLPDRELQDLEFAPTGDTIFTKTALPYPNDEEIRLTFYDVLTGERISQTGNIDVINAPIIPGDLVQVLNATPRYTQNGLFVVISYYRRAEAPRCAVWEVTTARLLWETTNTCGAISWDSSMMIIPQAHSNEYSAYEQLAVYNLQSGEAIAMSDDEVVEYRWLDESRIVIHRPYGDAPVIWDVQSNTRAVIELPYRLGVFWPASTGEIMFYSTDTVTYVWDIHTGLLERETTLNGWLVDQEDHYIVLNIPYNWRDLEPEEQAQAFVAYDFTTEQELWRARWQHSNMVFSPDGKRAAAYDEVFYTVDIFDLDTGTQLGSIPTLTNDYYLTDEWEWLVQISGSVYTVWGPADDLDRFENPPNARSTIEAPLYYDPTTAYEPASTLPEGQYVWLSGRSSNGEWLRVVSASGRNLWIEAENVEILTELDAIPIADN